MEKIGTIDKVPKYLRILDYFFLLRPILFFPGWSTLLAGYLVATHQNRWIGSYPLWGNVPLFQAMVAFAMAMGGCFILNQLQDVESDQENHKLFLLGEKYIPVRNGRMEAFLILAGAVLIAANISELFTLEILLFIGITGYFYNYPPFSMKNRPLYGLLANIFMGWLAFLLGAALQKSTPMGSVVVQSVPYVIFNTSLYLLTTLPDIEGDRRTHKITFAVYYGFDRTIWTSLALYAVAVLLAAVISLPILLAVAIGSFPFFVSLFFRRGIQQAVVALKMAIFFFILVVSVKFPPFFLLALIMFFLTRHYYQRRFQFTYPTFDYRKG